MKKCWILFQIIQNIIKTTSYKIYLKRASKIHKFGYDYFEFLSYLTLSWDRVLSLMLQKQWCQKLQSSILSTLFVALRMFYWYPGVNNKNNCNNKPDSKAKVSYLGKYLFTLINEQSNTIKDTIDTFIKELEKGFSISMEEELYSVIEKGYSLSFNNDFKPDKYLEKLWGGFFEGRNNLSDFVGK